MKVAAYWPLLIGFFAAALAATTSGEPLTNKTKPRLHHVPAATQSQGSSTAGNGAPGRQADADLDQISRPYAGSGRRPYEKPYAYVAMADVRRFSPGAPKIVFVCWETPGWAKEKALVRDAITASWQHASGLVFDGWASTCDASSAGIRIQIDDSGPRTLGLGTEIDGAEHGILLNFTLNKWQSACVGTREKCLQVIAVHEFGHALGFAHEQNRPDAPGECSRRAQGSDGTKLLTPYDPVSVMNYCDSASHPATYLSAGDRYSVAALYCGHTQPLCKPTL